MRIAVLFLQLCFLLLSGKHYYAVSKDSFGKVHRYLEKNHRYDYVRQSAYATIADADFDAEEEYAAAEDASDGDVRKLTATNFDFIFSRNPLAASASYSDNLRRGYRSTELRSGYSCPMYIVQRVIRI